MNRDIRLEGYWLCAIHYAVFASGAALAIWWGWFHG